MLPRNARTWAALGAAVTTAAFAAILPSAAVAGPVTCPSGEAYRMDAGDPPLALQGTCTGTGTITYSLDVPPTHGSLVGDSTGTATYTPNVGFSGTDQF